ncbi:hypothetical protein RvY_10815 [Ramazzottius varieornatus]|uniref:F-box domain-containing protein n=1 Tax=Ramazzottius varieornatus TaxID=947166 RepID=A0A1D1VJF1_RAMVA|nr:hypothetical protein RvY_10815 [Ramazzottius varieornatus]
MGAFATPPKTTPWVVGPKLQLRTAPSKVNVGKVIRSIYPVSELWPQIPYLVYKEVFGYLDVTHSSRLCRDESHIHPRYCDRWYVDMEVFGPLSSSTHEQEQSCEECAVYPARSSLVTLLRTVLFRNFVD